MTNPKTLYVSDLDETLIHTDERLSDFTVKAINSLIERGMIFSYATARSYRTASIVTKGLSPKLPVIVYNGSFILENGTQRKLLSNQFEQGDVQKILDLLLANEEYPLVHAYLDGVEQFSYCADRASAAQKKFLDRRIDDPRNHPVTDPQELYRGDIFCVTCMDTPERLLPLYEALKKELSCTYFEDIYTKEQWLEINPPQANKANAILSLKKMLGCDKVVCFGNGKNDVCMFEIADECYAVGNAVDELKAIATAVIDTNDNDGVAKWLLENYQA